MRGLSTTIVVILTLMIGISLVSVGYIFFLGTIEETTEVGEAVVEKTTQLLTTKYKIESLEQGTPGHIYIRNMGSNDLTDISVYINDVLDTTAVIPPLIAPNEVGTIDVIAGLGPGDRVKVSGAQGSFVIGTIPGGTTTTSPPATTTTSPGCLSDGSACTTGNQCCNGICEAGICVSLCGPCGAACSEGGYPFSDGTHTCDGSVNDACNVLNGVWDTCTQTGDNSDADCDANCQSGLSYCTTGGANPPFYWGRCVDLQNDDCSCGTCGNICLGGSTCQNGICTGGGAVGFIDADFESSTEGFTYTDDLYLGTVNPTRESGQRESNANCASGQCLAVNLNLEDTCTGCAAYSGGWENSFTINNPTPVRVTFDYTLRLAANTEATEWVTLYYRDVETGLETSGDVIVGDGNSPPDLFSSGTISYTTGVLPANTYDFDAGCHLTRVSAMDENAECWIDNVLIMNAWGEPSGFSPTGRSNHATVRCMGGQAPNLPNMKIRSLNIRANNTGTGAMAIYFGGTENNPSGATRQAEVINQLIYAGWNTFTLSPDLDWPANQITWVCWKRSGAAFVYYSTTSSPTTDFFTSHGRHDDGGGNPTVSFANSLGAASFGNYWYEAYLTYYQT